MESRIPAKLGLTYGSTPPNQAAFMTASLLQLRIRSVGYQSPACDALATVWVMAGYPLP